MQNAALKPVADTQRCLPRYTEPGTTEIEISLRLVLRNFGLVGVVFAIDIKPTLGFIIASDVPRNAALSRLFSAFAEEFIAALQS